MNPIQAFKRAKLSAAIDSQDVKLICETLFGVHITDGQEDIIDSIVFDENDKICICAYTRYGKTWAVSKAVLIWVYIHEEHEVDIIGPQYSQAQKLREYIAEDIISSPQLSDLVDSAAGKGTERLRKEVSKKHVTFKNDSHIRILSGEGTGDRLMGHGGQLIVIDESALLDYDTYRKKISRMKEQGHSNKEIHISNPWHRDNQFFQFWQNDNWKNVHIGWEQGVDEGRTTTEYIEERRELLTDIEFQILYDSVFPQSRDDALIPYSHILRAITSNKIDGKKVYGLDVAEKGADLTILAEGVKSDGYHINSVKVIDRDETMPIVAEVRTHISKSERINVDSIGVGAGVHSRLKEMGFNANSIRVGRAATEEKDRFLNQKSQFYWNLRDLFESESITIPDVPELKKQLSEIRWELTSGGKIKIIDPPKSPDYADAVMLCCAETKSLEGGFVAVDI